MSFDKFIVPHLISFESIDVDSDTSTYFDVDHEGSASDIIEASTTNTDETLTEERGKPTNTGLRRSMSMGDIAAVRGAIRKTTLTSSRSNLLAHTHEKKVSNQRYESVAEMVNKFWRNTPDRYRTKSKSCASTSSSNGAVAVTIPKTPNLQTKSRSRPTHVLSHEERELQDFEEAKKHQFKAHPVNKNILKVPLPKITHTKKMTVVKPSKLTKDLGRQAGPLVAKPMPTQPKPFSFEEMDKVRKLQHDLKINKMIEEEINWDGFHARPAPPQIKRQLEKKTLETLQPREMVTIPVPFSFEERNKELKKKKEEQIRKVMEEEKRLREFHANPMPKCILNAAKATSSTISVKSDDDKEEYKPFRAAPPVVLTKEPFVPKKAEKPLTEISTIVLNTDRRAKAREAFNRQLEEQERWKEQLRREHEERKKLIEEEEKRRLRKEAEYKANPVRNYKPVNIAQESKFTVPKTPQFMRKTKNDKEN